MTETYQVVCLKPDGKMQMNSGFASPQRGLWASGYARQEVTRLIIKKKYDILEQYVTIKYVGELQT